MKILVVKMNRLKEMMEDPAFKGEQKAKMEALFSKLDDEQKKTQTKITEILGRLQPYNNAVVEVSGEISPGTLIEICQTAIFVTEPLKRVRIRLDRDNNKLITEKLK